eukprot:gene39931-49354_t
MIMLAKVAVCGAVPITWLHTAELYPTEVRGTGHSMASVFGKVGGVLAIFWIDYFAVSHHVAGAIVVIGCMFATVVLTLMLPVSTSSYQQQQHDSSEDQQLNIFNDTFHNKLDEEEEEEGSTCLSSICSRVAIQHELDALFSEDLFRTTRRAHF